MRRVLGLLLLLALATGCVRSGGVATEGAAEPSASTPPAVESPPPAAPPVQATQAPSPAPLVPPTPQTPAPAPASPPVEPAGLGMPCDSKVTGHQRLDAIRSVLLPKLAGKSAAEVAKAVGSQQWTCVTAKPHQELVVVTDSTGFVPRGFLLAWAVNGDWYAAEMTLGKYVEQVGFWDVRQDGDTIDALVIAYNMGTGGVRQFYHATGDSTRGLTMVPVSEAYGKATVRPAGEDQVLITYRGNQWYELFPKSANCCLVMPDQVLLRWDGKTMVQVASRVMPNPVLTLNLIRIKPDSEAAALVIQPELVGRVRALFTDWPEGVYYDYKNEGFAQIIGRETWNWDALPLEDQTPLPDEIKHWSADLPAGRVELERRPEGWIVTAVELH